jgi:hypothetical protein
LNETPTSGRRDEDDDDGDDMLASPNGRDEVVADE